MKIKKIVIQLIYDPIITMRKIAFILKENCLATMKHTLPTGTFFDGVANFICAWVRLGYMPHVHSPRSFNEYILSSKMNFQGDIDLARRITDKFQFKEWLKEKDCEDLIVPTLGYYRSVAKVQHRTFEECTILKPTHLSGRVIIIHESRKLTPTEMPQIEKWLHTDYYLPSRARSYKDITHGIIHEPLLLDSNSNIPIDYKFHCFHGEPFMIQVDLDRFTNHTEQFYSKKWVLLDFGIKFPRNHNPIDKPECLSEALAVASHLSSDFVFCRVDLYLFPNKVLKAGEITFFPAGGMGRFSPEYADFLVGKKMQKIAERHRTPLRSH